MTPSPRLLLRLGVLALGLAGCVASGPTAPDGGGGPTDPEAGNTP